MLEYDGRYECCISIHIYHGLLLLFVTPFKVLVSFHFYLFFFSFCLLVVAVVSVVRRV